MMEKNDKDVKPLVSIIIPVFNVEAYIRKSVQSVIAQTYTNLEIILIDDGSTDESGLICEELAKNQGRIIVYHQKNQGVSSARNHGIKISTGRWLMFVDPDDWLEKDAVEKLVIAGNDSNADIVLGAYCWDINGINKRASVKTDGVHIYDVKKYRNEFIAACMVAPSEINGLFDKSFYCLPKLAAPVAKIYSAKLLKNNCLSFDRNLSFGEDLWLNCMAYGVAQRVVYVNKVVYHYVIRKGSATNSNLDMKRDMIDNLLMVLRGFIEDKDDNIKKAYCHFVMTYVEEYIQSCGMVVSRFGGFKKVKDKIYKLVRLNTVETAINVYVNELAVGKRERIMFYLIKKNKLTLALLICCIYYKLMPNKNRY